MEIQIPDPVILDIQPENITLDILYEDDDILIINKPKDMVVHPAPRALYRYAGECSDVSLRRSAFNY